MKRRGNELSKPRAEIVLIFEVKKLNERGCMTDFVENPDFHECKASNLTLVIQVLKSKALSKPSTQCYT